MANIASAKKRAIQAVKRRAHNTELRSRAYTYLKKARKAIASSAVADAQAAVKEAFSQIDRMVPKGIFHKNKAGRLKSRLNSSLKKKVLGQA
jgi:small subunit ribosomal protein S20